MRDNEKIVNYLDIPIQHCNGDVLRSMNRPGDRETLTKLVNDLRKEIPDITLRTTVMVGFPTETEEAFTELAEFISEMRFDRLGCFTYSPEEGTPAAEMEQLDDEVKKKRMEIIMEQQGRIAEEIANSHEGEIVDVLVEGYDGYIKHCFGRSAMDAPDVDCKVFFTTKRKKKVGEFVRVKVLGSMDLDLMGKEIV